MRRLTPLFFVALLGASPLPPKVEEIMAKPPYAHANWNILVKDLTTGEIIHDLGGNKFVSPASTTKLFSTAALLDAYGADYTFKTPVYTEGTLENGILKGNLVLVGQGDMVFGGRAENGNKIAFTPLDHIVANEVPGVTLTKGDPLQGLIDLAKQIKAKGVKEVQGDVVIDDSLFETTVKRGFTLSPVFINENMIDLIINPTSPHQKADLSHRPQVKGYEVINEVVTGNKLQISVESDETGKIVIVKGEIPENQKNVVRVAFVKDPQAFVKAAFTQVLEKEGIKISSQAHSNLTRSKDPIAEFVSPPLMEYVKLILKVSHNVGADLVAPLLAAKAGEKTFEAGMLKLGEFTEKVAGISPNEFVFGDAAGGEENRLTPHAELQLLEYMSKLPIYPEYQRALPILGVDGSLADFGKKTEAVGKVKAKTGTGVSYNAAQNKLFLTTQTLAGYIDGKNGHTYEFMVSVNNANMPTIEDIFPIFEDESQIAAEFYQETGK